MIGNGIPSIHSSAPFPKPMCLSFGYKRIINKMIRVIGIPRSHKMMGMVRSSGLD